MRSFRRSFLKSGLTWGAMGRGFLNILGRQEATAATTLPDKKLLFIFQRGGNDGINTVIPRGDLQYNTTLRPSIFIPEANGIDLGNGFAQLHPAMAPIMEIYNNQSLNGLAGAGNLAVLHRIGYANQSRSHFDSQDYWERGVPGERSVKDGMLYRHLAATADLNHPDNALAAASLSSNSLAALEGQKPFPNFNRITDFNFYGNDAERLKFRGQLPGEGTPGKGLMGLYGGSTIGGRSPSGLVHPTGTALGTTIESVSSAVEGDYVPANGAVYPGGTLGRKLMEAAVLFKNTDTRILGINIGGHDNHTNQGGVNGTQAENLAELSEGFLALYHDLQDQWDKLVVVTMTEFGRTSEENGSNGTDHAEASAMFVAGGGVNGGVYNCDASTWETGPTQEDSAMFKRRDRYLSRKTDFRSVFAEIFVQHFGDDPALLETIIPGYGQAVADYPDEMSWLGFMS